MVSKIYFMCYNIYVNDIGFFKISLWEFYYRQNIKKFILLMKERNFLYGKMWNQ